MVMLRGPVRELCQAANQAHVATVLPDGAPHSVPVWIGVEGEQVVFFTGPGSRKARNIAGDPRVAISITDREQPFRMAMIRGRGVGRLRVRPVGRSSTESRPSTPAVPTRVASSGSCSWLRPST